MRRWLAPLAACLLGCGGGFHPIADGGDDGGDGAAGDAAGITTIADTRAGPVALALSPPGPPTVVYWAEVGSATQGQRDGAIRSAAADCATSCVTPLATSRPAPSGIAVSPDGTQLFWSESENAAGDLSQGTVWQLDLGSMQTMQLAQGQGWPRRVVASDTSILWLNEMTGEVRREDYPGGTPDGLPIVQALDSPARIAITLDQFANADTIYWTNAGTNGSDGSLWTADSHGGGAHAIASNLAGPAGVALDSTWVYCAESGTGVLLRAAHDGTGAGPYASSLAAPKDVAVDLDRVYWVEAGTPPYYKDGRVSSLRIGGTLPDVIASGRRNPSAIALDQGYVYWTEFGAPTADMFDGGVYRAPKPK
jgi:sugar lactone lactonase YvrE